MAQIRSPFNRAQRDRHRSRHPYAQIKAVLDSVADQDRVLELCFDNLGFEQRAGLHSAKVATESKWTRQAQHVELVPSPVRDGGRRGWPGDRPLSWTQTSTREAPGKHGFLFCRVPPKNSPSKGEHR
jgi:hypothetical protein